MNKTLGLSLATSGLRDLCKRSGAKAQLGAVLRSMPRRLWQRQNQDGEKLGVKDLADPALQAGVADEEMTKTIKNSVRSGGNTKIKAYGDLLTEDEIRQLVKLIRSFKK